MVMFMVKLQQTYSYKELERLLACVHPSECIEGLFSVQVHLHSSTQMCVQRVFDKLYEPFEVVVFLEKHSDIKLFKLTVLAKQC